MEGDYKFVFKSTGQYIGFVYNNNLFTRDGIFSGWIDMNTSVVWNQFGHYKGKMTKIGDAFYILKNLFEIPPIPQSPKPPLTPPPLPLQQENIFPIELQPFIVDGY
jgi:hypothetical protein